MITINPKAQSIASTNKLKKNSKKDSAKKTKFVASNNTQEASNNDATSAVTDVSGMLFLQEIDEQAEDQQNLEEFSKKAFKTLKNLQFDLLQGSVSSRRLHNLKDILDSSKTIIRNPEMTKIAEEIKLRIEVEIAKLEVNNTNCNK